MQSREFHPLDYAPPMHWRWQRWWQTRWRRMIIRVSVLVVALVAIAMNPLWFAARTYDDWSTFSATRNTTIGLGSYRLYSTSTTVLFQHSAIVDPLTAPFPGGVGGYTGSRGKSFSWVGIYPPRKDMFVECARGMWAFDVGPHAISFVAANAMNHDRGFRTKLAEAICTANAPFDGSRDRKVVPQADANAWRIFRGMTAE